MRGDLPTLLLSIAMLGVFALAIGGIWLIARRRDFRRGGLMLATALVLLANVLIAAWPVAAAA